MAKTNGHAAGASDNDSYVVSVDYLIVGTGPAGGSLACFLVQHGESHSLLQPRRETSNHMVVIDYDRSLQSLTCSIARFIPSEQSVASRFVCCLEVLSKKIKLITAFP